MPTTRTRRSRASSSAVVAPPRKSEAFDTLEHCRRFARQMLVLPDDRGRFEFDGWQVEVGGTYFGTGQLPREYANSDLDDLIRAGKLQPGDAAFLRGAARETLGLVPTGCGKTTLYACLGLHHGTFVRRNARSLIVSSTVEQAKKMLAAAEWFVLASPLLKAWWEIRPFYGSGGRLVSTFDKSVIEVVSANPAVADGDAPTQILADELHEHADDGEGYGRLLGKWKKRRARALAASTAGDDPESYLGRKRDLALDPDQGGNPIEDLRPGEYYRRGEQHDMLGALEAIVHEWAVPDGVDVNDLEEVKKATPASYVTLADLASDHAKTRARPWDWERLHCNRWTRGGRSAINPMAWRDQADGTLAPEAFAHLEYFAILDVGGVSDSTAVTAMWRGEDIEVPDLSRDDEDAKIVVPELYTAGTQIVWPPGGGEITRLEDILNALDVVCAYPGRLLGVVYDPNSGGRFIINEVIKRRPELLFIEHGQQAEMDDASAWLAQSVVQGWLHHDDDPQVTKQVLAAVAKRSRRKAWYLAKPERRGGAKFAHLRAQDGPKVDAAVTLAMGVRTHLFPPDLSAPEPFVVRVLNR